MTLIFFFIYTMIFCIFFLIVFDFLLKLNKNRPPSPFSFPIIGHLYLFNTKSITLSLKELSDHYGPIMFLWFGSKPVLVLTSPSAVEECLTKNDVIFANRPPFIAGKHLGYDYTTLEWTSYGHHWKNLRRLTNIEFLSSTRLQASSSIRNEEVKCLIHQLNNSSLVERYQNVNMKEKFHELGLTIIMRMVAGHRHFRNDMKWSSNTVVETFLPPRLMNMVDFVPVLRFFGYQGTERNMIRMRKKKDIFLETLVQEHRNKRKYCCSNTKKEAAEGDKTMIDTLLSLQEKDSGFYTDEYIKGIIGTMFAAGIETSVATMIWVMSLLMDHPKELAKLRNEIDLHIKGDIDRFLSEDDLPKLPYLQCVINETLRLHPPAGTPLPHQSSEECSIGGYDIPSGTTLVVNAWAIQRDPKLWVEPTRFMPERFEGGKQEIEGFKWLPFGAGRRGCPGSGLAYRVVGLSIGSLIQCFDWKKVEQATVEMQEEIEPYEIMYKPRLDKMNLLSQFKDQIPLSN